MMCANQPGFDVAEQRVNDREEFAGIGAVVLDHRGVFQIVAEIGAAIAGKPVGQQMRIGGDIGFEEGCQFGPRRRRQHGDAGVTGEEPVLALDGVAMLCVPVGPIKTGEESKMAIEFYDVKKREKVQIPESEVKKTTYERQGKDGKTQVRYAFRAVNEGTKLTKFASKEDWDALDAPVE